MGIESQRLAGVDYADLDLSFLNWKLPEAVSVLRAHAPSAGRRVAAPGRPRCASTIADLDLTYYLPCTVRGRTIAYLGVSRTDDGEYLSSVDVELLLTLAGYVGIAIENAILYRSLQRKVEEYERLKEFSENIVESINVGILAADLDDRVESWNTQIEQLSGVAARARAGPQALASCSPPNWPSSSTACAARPASTTSTSSCSSRRAPHGRRQRQWQRQRQRAAGALPRGHPEHRHRAAGLQGPGADRPPDHLRRRHRPRRTGAAPGAGRQAVAASACWRPAWRTKSTRRWR